MRKIILILVVAVAVTGISIPKSKAMDPITIAVLAPYAIPVAEVAGQYALKGLGNAAMGMVDVFKDMVGVFMLPVGFFEVSFGAPFGLFQNGCEDLLTGAEAPFKLCFSTLMLVPRLLCLYNGR